MDGIVHCTFSKFKCKKIKVGLYSIPLSTHHLTCEGNFHQHKLPLQKVREPQER